MMIYTEEMLLFLQSAYVKRKKKQITLYKFFEYTISVLQTRMFYYVNGNLDYVTNVKIITAMQKCMTNSCIFTWVLYCVFPVLSLPFLFFISWLMIIVN